MKCRCGEEYIPNHMHYAHMRTEYKLHISGELKAFCRDCGDEIDENGFCYCHR